MVAWLMLQRSEADGVWITDNDAVPAQQVGVSSEWDHAIELPAGTAPLDNCLTTWKRTARIRGLGRGVTITADAAFRHLQVYTPRQYDFFCVEPVSDLPAAINHPDVPPGQGMCVLRPGEALSGDVTIVLSPCRIKEPEAARQPGM
jgi:aldose 1-epimerase